MPCLTQADKLIASKKLSRLTDKATPDQFAKRFYVRTPTRHNRNSCALTNRPSGKSHYLPALKLALL
jgi:hypothetical protein